MKVRHVCAIVGVAIAAGAVVFMRSLVATNDHQAIAVAEKLLTELPIEKGTFCANLQLDYRPDGRVMQGPPMMATIAVKGCIEGVEVTKALFAQRRLAVPDVGTELTLVGRKGAYKVKIDRILDWERPVRGYPNMFVDANVAKEIDESWAPSRDWSTAELAPLMTSDVGRNFGYAKVLLLWAAALTALCLLVNSLFLSIEAKRRNIALMRVVGATNGNVAFGVRNEACLMVLLGFVLGTILAIAALYGYVAFEHEVFPMGPAVDKNAIAVSFAAAVVIAVVASQIAIRKALSVKPLEAASAEMPKRRHLGMLISFAFGFGAFVAVEVWGASLMHAFVPSPEWPDAIVSILPGGTSSFDVDKIKEVEGASAIAELQPLQVNIGPLEEIKGRGTGNGERGMKGRKQYKNALLLASDYLPKFKFSEGTWEECRKKLLNDGGDYCIITDMMARAKKLKLGDALKLDCGGGFKMSLEIVGIVDLNWHMVTSRGLLRGLNRMPVHTDGPIFVSFDTLAACDARPQQFVNMTHLWVEYEPGFVEKCGGVFEAGRIMEKRIVEALDGAYGEDREGNLHGNTVRLHSRDEIADGTLAHGDDIIGSMAKIPFIFIAVISLGFIAMIVASADARRREFLSLRAVGATRGQLAAILTKEAISTALGGIVLGLVFGSAAGWLFTFSTRAAMGSWGLPPVFAVPWLVIAKGALGAVLFALVVAIPAAMSRVSRP